MWVLARAFTAHACPSCATGEQARSEVWTDGVAANVGIALLPFVIIGAICVWAEARARPRH